MKVAAVRFDIPGSGIVTPRAGSTANSSWTTSGAADCIGLNGFEAAALVVAFANLPV